MLFLIAVKEPYVMMWGFFTEKKLRCRLNNFFFFFNSGPLKLALAIEAKAWKMLLCRYLNEEYKKKMTDMMSFITEYLKKLSRPLCDLDDVRFAMEALSIIRDNKIQMDMTLGPIEVRCLLIFYLD